MARACASGAPSPVLDPVALEGILSACHEGDVVLADERLSSALAALGSRGDGVSSTGLSGDTQAQALVNACAEAGDPQLAAAWFERLHVAGLRPGTEALGVVLAALAAKDLAGDAEEFFARVHAAGAEADEANYSLLIASVGEAGEVDRAETWFCRMRAAGIRASPVSYAAVLKASAAACDHRRAERWLARMDTVGVPPDTACFAAVIQACAAAGCAERAEMWLRHVTGGGAGAPGPMTTRQCYTATALAYAAEGDYVDVERIQAEMEEWGIGLDEHGMSVLLSAYSNAGPVQDGRPERAFRSYVAHGLAVTEPLVHQLRALIGDQRFVELLAEGLLGPAPAVA